MPMKDIQNEDNLMIKALYFYNLFIESGKVSIKHKNITLSELQFQEMLLLFRDLKYFDEDLNMTGDVEHLQSAFKRYDEDPEGKHSELFFWIMRIILHYGFLKFAKSSMVGLILINFTLEDSTFIHRAVYLLKNLEAKKDIEVDVYILEFKAKLKFLMLKDEYDEYIVPTVNIHHYVRIMKQASKNMSKLENLCTIYIKFWTLYNSNEVKISELMVSAKKCVNESNIIKNEWEKETYSFSNIGDVPKVYLTYSLFLILSRNLIRKSEKFFKIYQNLITKISKGNLTEDIIDDNILSYDNVVLIVSGNKDNPGIINTCTPSIKALLGYHVNSIIGQSLNIILPQFINQRHDGYMKRYSETGRYKLLNKNVYLPALKSNKTITPITITIKEMKTQHLF